jgi:hypothetical protein
MKMKVMECLYAWRWGAGCPTYTCPMVPITGKY